MQNMGFLFFFFFSLQSGLNTVSMAVNPTLTQIKFQCLKIYSAREGQRLALSEAGTGLCENITPPLFCSLQREPV